MWPQGPAPAFELYNWRCKKSAKTITSYQSFTPFTNNIVVSLGLELTRPDHSSPPRPWLVHPTSPVSRPNIAEFVTRIDPAWIFGLMEKILSKKISSFIRRDKWLLYLMDTRILNHKEITRRWCWWNSRHMYSYYFVKLILISRKLKYFIVTCKSHLSYPSYPSSMNDFLLSSRMSWKYN